MPEPRPRRRLRDLRALNPTVLLGVLLLVAGLALSLLQVRGGGAEDRSSSPFARTVQSAIQLAQTFILWGDKALSETQPRFNSIVVSAFLEGISPGQRRTLETVAQAGRVLLGDLFSPLGLVTLAALAVGYVAVARAFDARFPRG